MSVICVGNWKMNGSLSLVEEIGLGLNGEKFKGVEVIVAPPYTLLGRMREVLGREYQVGSQGVCGLAAAGAYTGGIGVDLLVDVGVEWVIVGHSERKLHFKEEEGESLAGVRMGLRHGLGVIYCLGETEEERASGRALEVLRAKLNGLEEVLVNEGLIDSVGLEVRLYVAYEPIWAIGTGKVPSKEEISEVVELIRGFGRGKFKTVLYGGSVGLKNIKDLLSIQGLNGFLIGGASLSLDFIEMAKLCSQVDLKQD
ncbi:triosephosphate isomerase (TIM) [Nematocida homosporus]|uniref:triosephosphate isomerase (TIM) n=1 Tax=Nematocida homosporus TaxID=1912981 RepID=UPI002220B720|nr:triosephosphate isomerase (TIM) [Nematocida homosporus]KAI5184606.1 triosephosphate isomerase (TIM) [Nematocida homosporus]